MTSTYIPSSTLQDIQRIYNLWDQYHNYTQVAAEFYSILPSQVTPAHRWHVKTVLFGHVYGSRIPDK